MTERRGSVDICCDDGRPSPEMIRPLGGAFAADDQSLALPSSDRVDSVRRSARLSALAGAGSSSASRCASPINLSAMEEPTNMRKCGWTGQSSYLRSARARHISLHTRLCDTCVSYSE